VELRDARGCAQAVRVERREYEGHAREGSEDDERYCVVGTFAQQALGQGAVEGVAILASLAKNALGAPAAAAHHPHAPSSPLLACLHAPQMRRKGSLYHSLNTALVLKGLIRFSVPFFSSLRLFLVHLRGLPSLCSLYLFVSLSRPPHLLLALTRAPE